MTSNACACWTAVSTWGAYDRKYTTITSRFKLGQCDTYRKHTRITSVTKVTLGAVTGVTPTTGKCMDNDSGYKSDVWARVRAQRPVSAAHRGVDCRRHYTQVREEIVETVQNISQERISERIIEDCPWASAPDFGRDRRVAAVPTRNSTDLTRHHWCASSPFSIQRDPETW